MNEYVMVPEGGEEVLGAAALEQLDGRIGTRCLVHYKTGWPDHCERSVHL